MKHIKTFIILTLLLPFLSCEVRVNANHVSEGNKLVQQGDYFNAELEYDDAVFEDPDNVEALKGQVYCYMLTGNFDKALKAANHCIALGPDDVKVYNDRGLIYQNKKEFEKAIADYDKTIEMNTPYKTTAYFNKGVSLLLLKRYDDAMRCFQTVLEYDKNDYPAASNIGELFLLKDQRDSACFYFEKAKQSGDPDVEKKILKNCR